VKTLKASTSYFSSLDSLQAIRSLEPPNHRSPKYNLPGNLLEIEITIGTFLRAPQNQHPDLWTAVSLLSSLPFAKAFSAASIKYDTLRSLVKSECKMMPRAFVAWCQISLVRKKVL
jgi:hypothetical protein